MIRNVKNHTVKYINDGDQTFPVVVFSCGLVVCISLANHFKDKFVFFVAHHRKSLTVGHRGWPNRGQNRIFGFFRYPDKNRNQIFDQAVIFESKTQY